jgi:hypothetical protein
MDDNMWMNEYNGWISFAWLPLCQTMSQVHSYHAKSERGMGLALEELQLL